MIKRKLVNWMNFGRLFVFVWDLYLNVSVLEEICSEVFDVKNTSKQLLFSLASPELATATILRLPYVHLH